MLDTKFWERYFKVYDMLNLFIPYQELLGAVCRELDIKKGKRILEAGYGTGNLALGIERYKKSGGSHASAFIRSTIQALFPPRKEDVFL